jgi:hypothetical protein
MRAPDRRQDEAALERLREHEAALSHRLETARAEAVQVRQAADAQAAAVRNEGRRDLEQEIATTVAAAESALEEELRLAREESARAVELARADALPRRGAAIARAIEAACGGPP